MTLILALALMHPQVAISCTHTTPCGEVSTQLPQVQPPSGLIVGCADGACVTTAPTLPAFFLADSIYTSPLMTCATLDSDKVKDCKIADGHTLDEVINYLLKSQRAQYDSNKAVQDDVMAQWQTTLDQLGDVTKENEQLKAAVKFYEDQVDWTHGALDDLAHGKPIRPYPEALKREREFKWPDVPYKMQSGGTATISTDPPVKHCHMHGKKPYKVRTCKVPVTGKEK
jgi:hypothetical protein